MPKKEISEAERQEVLMKVGSNAISTAINREGILVVGDPTTFSRRKAEIWAKREAVRCSVSFEVLHDLVTKELNRLIMEEIKRYE